MKPGLKQNFFALFIICLVITTFGSTITVSKNGAGQFSSVQEAVDAAEPGDQIVILDSETYEEQVTIDSTKSGITLKSQADPKPEIRWQDRKHIHPLDANDVINEIIDYDCNGALRILGTSGIIVDGIAVDGDGPFIFGAKEVWDQIIDFQHGNAAITISRSADIIIRNCETKNAFIGIYINDAAIGGIGSFGVNPSDVMISHVSKFGSTGNHLIEENRIHNNSWGLFLETIWGLGSVVRYNLFFENHHYSDEFAQEVKNFTDEGTHNPGGAVLFKDDLMSPVAIYNNTFWRNFMRFASVWQSGGQHLVFNNIYGTPFRYLTDYFDFPVETLVTDTVFKNRMHNCVYASQFEEASVSINDGDTVVTGVNIIPGFEVEKSGSQISKGALIIKPFPNEAENRWLETEFISTDPDNPDFLTPDWDNPFVQEFIVNKGWAACGLRDSDGSMADIGAISSVGVLKSITRITPLAPVKFDKNRAIVNFNLVNDSSFKNPEMKYFSVVKNLVFQINAFGNNIDPIKKSDIIELPDTFSIKPGNNTLIVDVTDPGENAFFEMTIEGTGSDGKKVLSSVGFIPYRKMIEKVEITVLDKNGEEKLDTVKAGDTAQIKIEAPESMTAEKENSITPVKIVLSYGTITDLQNKDIEIEYIDETVTIPVIFNELAENGNVFVIVSGVIKYSELVFAVSDPLTVKDEKSSINNKKPKINSMGDDKKDSYTVFSINGRLVYSGKEMSFGQLNSRMKMLGRGVFLVKRHSPDGMLKSTRKVVRY